MSEETELSAGDAVVDQLAAELRDASNAMPIDDWLRFVGRIGKTGWRPTMEEAALLIKLARYGALILTGRLIERPI